MDATHRCDGTTRQTRCRSILTKLTKKTTEGRGLAQGTGKAYRRTDPDWRGASAASVHKLHGLETEARTQLFATQAREFVFL